MLHSTSGEAPDATLRCLRSFRPAFTIVELIVVITVIVIVLAIAVPGLSAMNAQARQVSARQLINGVMTRAYYQALADRAMTAVRFFPGTWDTIDSSEKQIPAGRQHAAIYEYVGTTMKEWPPGSGSFLLQFGEYFQRLKDASSVLLPEDVWAAPMEALQRAGTIGHVPPLIPTSYAEMGRDFVLNGVVSGPTKFAFNADRGVSGSDGGSFLNADDFLVVCDPDTGVRTGTPQPYRLRAYAPTLGYDVDSGTAGTAGVYYQRYSFSGIVTYAREAFAAQADSAKRQGYLRDSGRAYLVHRFSGGLLAGAQPPQ